MIICQNWLLHFQKLWLNIRISCQILRTVIINQNLFFFLKNSESRCYIYLRTSDYHFPFLITAQQCWATKVMTIHPSTNLTRLVDRHMSLTLLSLDMVLPVSSQLFSSLGGGGGGEGDQNFWSPQ